MTKQIVALHSFANAPKNATRHEPNQFYLYINRISAELNLVPENSKHFRLRTYRHSQYNSSHSLPDLEYKCDNHLTSTHITEFSKQTFIQNSSFTYCSLEDKARSSKTFVGVSCKKHNSQPTGNCFTGRESAILGTRINQHALLMTQDVHVKSCIQQ